MYRDPLAGPMRLRVTQNINSCSDKVSIGRYLQKNVLLLLLYWGHTGVILGSYWGHAGGHTGVHTGSRKITHTYHS